ncbi:hypothetical protein [Rhodohalobacter halophilus]|uniref:hypothetical protein n=1 Tax=Rhodohalobacter halophilus TaxID=1812810 RepID=UPI00083FB36F|nr:hypothetical protein [Rhodohalobacter halophilus]
MKVNSYILLIILFLASSFDAFSLFGIPLEWIFTSIVIFLGAFLIKPKLFKKFNYLKIWAVFIYICSILSCLFVFTYGGDLKSLYPSNTTTGYWVYIILRYLTLVLPIVAILLFINLSQLQYNRLNRVIIIWGGVIALYSIYSYLAVIYDLPILSKSRMSTSGGEQKDFYANYIINRATGTFREPAFLGAWLLLPFFVSLKVKSIISFTSRSLIILAVLLTGSLTAYITLFLSLIVYFVLKAIKESSTVVKFISKMAGAAASVLIILSFVLYIFINIAEVNLEYYTDFIWNRVKPIVYGMEIAETNRADPYKYIIENGIPWIGNGPGNANLLLTQFKGSSTISSFLNIYINYLFAVGILFSPILIAIFIYPLWLCVEKFSKITPQVISLYVSMLIVGSALNQEFSIALIYSICFIIYESKKGTFQSNLSY